MTLELTVQVSGYNGVSDERHLYVSEPAEDPRTTVVAAYRLTDWTVAWRTRLPGEAAGNLGLWGEALLVVATDDGSGANPGGDRTTRLDTDSGGTLWTVAGWPVNRSGDRLLLSRSTSYSEPGEHPLTNLTAVDLATGHEAWSIEANRWDYSAGDAATLVTLDSESTLTTYDLATGELLATGPTAASNGPLEGSYWATLRTIGSTVMLAEELDGEFVFGGYDVATLQRRWTLAADRALTVWPEPCGDLVCLNDPLDVPRAIDPASGRTVWTADWLTPISGEGGYNIYDPDLPELAGYGFLIREAWRSDDPLDRQSWLIDLATGGPVLDIGQWDFTGGLRWLTGAPSTMLTLAAETGTWIGRLRPDLSGVDALGRIESATLNEYGYGTYCAPTASHVLCFTDVRSDDSVSHSELAVWRLR